MTVMRILEPLNVLCKQKQWLFSQVIFGSRLPSREAVL